MIDLVDKRARSGDCSTVFEITLRGVDALLMTAVPGADLAVPVESQPPESMVEMLVSALQAFHSVKASDCPFEAYVPG